MTLMDQQNYCKRNLPSISEYLNSRSISPEISEEFGIGYCDSNPPVELMQFKNRLMFPINDLSGDIVGFGGRALDSDGPKYINSHDSDIYKKSRVLYGLDKSQDYILNKGYIVLVEGYFDLIRLWANGFKNVASISGTALSKYQCRLLRRFADTVVLCLDGDGAGKTATLRSCDILKEELIPFRVVNLPDGLDPDEFILERGIEEFVKKVNA
jgi:DNA primase